MHVEGGELFVGNGTDGEGLERGGICVKNERAARRDRELRFIGEIQARVMTVRELVVGIGIEREGRRMGIGIRHEERITNGSDKAPTLNMR